MDGFKPGQVVTVVSLNRNRTIVAVSGQNALCKSFSTKEEDWFPFSDLRADDHGPIRPHF